LLRAIENAKARIVTDTTLIGMIQNFMPPLYS
jgi:hypothetical protein